MKSSNEFPSSFFRWWQACLFFLRMTGEYTSVRKLCVVPSPLLGPNTRPTTRGGEGGREGEGEVGRGQGNQVGRGGGTRPCSAAMLHTSAVSTDTVRDPCDQPSSSPQATSSRSPCTRSSCSSSAPGLLPQHERGLTRDQSNRHSATPPFQGRKHFLLLSPHQRLAPPCS